MTTLASGTQLLASFGLVAVLCGLIATMRFALRRAHRPALRPAVTILKPLCGDEPGLEAALASTCDQDYPDLQIVFGVTDSDDPALGAVRRVRARFPDHDIRTIVDPDIKGTNRKIANLLNMIPAAKHDVLVFSDSDLHVSRNYIDSVVAALAHPRVGLVTTICAGRPTVTGLAARLGATAITHSFLPGVLVSRALGRADCLGTTMALRRETLAQIGGLAFLVRHVGDDNVLGRRVRELGLHVALADTVPATAVPETSLGALWSHELRWARTIRALEPVLFATSIIQYPLFWAALAMMLSGGSYFSVALFGVAWAVRVLAAAAVDRALRCRSLSSSWLLPLRDMMSAAIVLASYCGTRVVWRGHSMRVAGYQAHQAATCVHEPWAVRDAAPLNPIA